MDDIKNRMSRIGLSQVDLILELQKKNIYVQPPMLSSVLRGVYTYPKAKAIMDECIAIIEVKEHEFDKQSN